MPTYFAFFWVPYLIILFYLYSRKSIYAPILLIWVGMLNYKLPVFFVANIEPSMWFVGVLFCILITLADISIGKKLPFSYQIRSDVVLKKAVLVFVALVFFSVMMGNYDFMKKVTFGVDVALIFFIIVRCLKTEKDKSLLLKGIVFGVFLMASVGMIGYALDDPFWGHTVSQDETAILEVHAMSDLTYEERLFYQTLYSRGKILYTLSLRPRFTSSSPNDMASTMLLAIPIAILFFLKKGDGIHKRLIWLLGILLFTASILLSGSLTILIVGSLILPFLALKLFLSQYVSKIVFLSLLVTILASSAFILSDDISSVSKSRMSSLSTLNDVLDAHGRAIRWQIHLQRVTPSLLLIGNGLMGSTGGAGTMGQGHMNYISTLYRGGGVALFAFLVCLFRSMRKSLNVDDKLVGYCIFTSLLTYALVGITLDTNISTGPPFIFWSLVAIAAKSISRTSIKNMRV